MKRLLRLSTGSLILLTISTVNTAFADADRELEDIDPRTHTARIEGQDEARVLVVESKGPKGQRTRQVFTIETLPKDFPMFHWTTEENQKRWLAQGGKIDAGEIGFLSTPSGEKQAYGPGWYVSENPLDSKSFGVKAVRARMPGDINILRATVKPDTAEKAGRTLQKLRELGILGTHVNDTWYTFFDHWPASRLDELTLDRALDALSRPGAKKIESHMMRELVDAFGLSPHPFFDKHFPGLAKLMKGKALEADELKKVQKDFFPYIEGSDLQKQLWGYLTPANRLEVMKAVIPPKQDYISSIVAIETKLGNLPPMKDLEAVYPRAVKLLTGAPLTAEERVKVKAELEGMLYSEPEAGSKITARLREEFAPELRRHFIGQASTSFNMGYGRENTVTTARGWGVPISSLVDGAKDVGRYNEGLMGDTKEIAAKLNDFGKKLLDSYQYIGEADLTVAAVQGNSQPWSRYDEPGLAPLSERWDAAMKLDDDASPVERVSALAGKTMEYRDQPLTAGGDIFLPGQKDGYFRATADEVNALKANPFLKVRTVRDPWPQSEAYETLLVRYDYASPGHFEQFAQHLPEDLLTELRAAAKAGDLLDTGSETYRDLCRRMVEHLSTNMDKGADTALEKYVRRISVHPFTDMNGRFARLAYAKEQGEPLTMRHWNLDLLTTPEELAALRDEGKRQHLARALDLKAMEAKDPKFPRYYEAPEIFEGFFHSPVALGDKDAHRKAMQDFFRNPEHVDMVRKKEISMLEWRAWDMEVDRLLGLPTAQRDAALLAWARANLRPEPRTRARFEALLKASREAAQRGSPAREVMSRWWIDLSSGDNPAFADSLAHHVRELPADLRNALIDERLVNRISPRVDFGPEIQNEIVARAEARLKGPAGAGRQDAAVFLVDKEAGNKANLQKAILRFAKDPEAEAITKQVLNSPSAAARTETVHALIDLPRNTLNKEMRSGLLEAAANLPESAQLDVALKLVNHPDHWLTTDTWRRIAMFSGGEGEEGGGSGALTSTLKDKRMKEKLLERMKKDSNSAAFWQQMAYALGDDGMTEQQKLYQAMADGKSWRTFAGMLDAQRYSLEYLVSDDMDADASGRKLAAYLEKEIPKMIKEAPEHTAQGKLALRMLAKTPEAKASLGKEALEGLALVGPNDRKKVLDSFIELARSAARGEEGEGALALTDVLKKSVASGPEMTKRFFSKMKLKDLQLLEDVSSAVPELAKVLSQMPAKDRLAILRQVLPAKGGLGSLLIAETMENKNPVLRAALGELLAEPDFARHRWSILHMGVEKDPALGSDYIRRALSSRGVAKVSDAEAVELSKAIKALSLKPSADTLYGPKAIQAPLEQRLALLNEFDAQAPRAERLGREAKFQAQLRAELQKGAKGNALEALAFVEKNSEDAWIAMGKTLGALGADTKPTLAEAIAVMNRSVPVGEKLHATGVPDLLAAAGRLKGAELNPLIELLGKQQDLNSDVIKFLGKQLLANDPAISEAAAKALANLPFREKGGKEQLMPILQEYVENKGGARQKLAGLLRRAGIDYEKEILPLEKARAINRDLASGKIKPCSGWFKAWGI
jgi:hypothetical protein